MGGVFDLFDLVHEKEAGNTPSLAVQLQPVHRHTVRCRGGGTGLLAEDPHFVPENEEVPDRDFNGEA